MNEDPLVGSTLSERYRIDELIGSGAMGRVYRAEHVLMRKTVAIKVLHQELTNVAEITQRFEREARAAAQIEHAHVAAATDFGKLSDGSFFLVLEFIGGVSLTSVIEEGPMALSRVLNIARQVCSALESAHARGIVHRDLKPDNLHLVEGEEEEGDFVKILDFGIAKLPSEKTEGEAITQVGLVYGTPEYMAPEQALGQEVDARADLYSLGVIMYEMLTGRRPYLGQPVALLGQQLSSKLPKMASVAKVRVPAPVEQLVKELLQPDAEGRIESARQVREQLDALLLALAEGKLVGRGSMLSISLEELSPQAEDAQPLSSVSRGSRKSIGRAFVIALLFGGLGLILTTFLVGVIFEGQEEVASSTGTKGSGATEGLGPNLDGALNLAREKGVDALTELAKRFPEEGLILADLALAQAQDKRYLDATESVRSALALNPSLNENAKIGGALFRSAQSAEARAVTFRLLDGAMGSAGVAIIYDLANTQGVSSWVSADSRRRLKTEELRAAASPAMLLLLRLEEESKCEELAQLVLRAEQVGDKRALPRLKKLGERTGCGSKRAKDCFECLRLDDRLEKAVRAIEGRAALDKDKENFYQ